MTTQKTVWSLLLSGALVTAACGDSKSLNPVGPSAVVVEGPQSDTASGGVSGPQAKGGIPGPPQDKGGNRGPKAPSNTTPGAPTAPGLKKVEIEGLITGKSGDSIIVNGQQIVVPSTCPIRHGQTPFTFADLKFGDRVHVRANRLSSEGSGSVAATSLEATEVILQNPGDGEGSGDDTPTLLVSVMATDAFASETAGDSGTFTLSRSGNAASLTTPLTVNYTVTGTALSGTDYTALSGTATFVAGSATAIVTVSPIVDPALEGAETVILTLSTVPDPYDLGSPAFATVTITDTNTPLVSVAAFDSSAREVTGDPGTFRFTRSGSTAATLTVNFTVSGTATSGVDYTALPVSVTFAAGSATADVAVTPLRDSDNQEGSETVIVTVTDGPTYDLGASPSATVTIAQ
jgi:hypothetical protein